MKLYRAVTVVLVAGGLAGACAAGVRDSEGPSHPSASGLSEPARASAPVPSQPGAEAPPAAPAVSATPLATTPPGPSAPSTPDAPAVSAASSAYAGCGEPIPSAKLWDETTEDEVLAAIDAARACAKAHGRRVLLEFVAPWCDDCQEMARLDAAPIVASALSDRFERVRVNVGKWDRHEGLRKRHRVQALATYVVVDPSSSRELSRTTLEPISKKGQKLSPEAWVDWLRRH